MISCSFENGDKAHLRHIVVNVIVVKKNKILLGKRGTYNGKPITEFGKWGLIGGYLDRNETLVEGAKREVREETGWEIESLRLFIINDTPDRPMEDKQNIDIIFTANAVKRKSEFKSNEEISNLKWFNLNKLPPRGQIAFDHADSLILYKKYQDKKFKIPKLKSHFL